MACETAAARRGVSLQARLETMRAGGMSETGIRRALGLSAGEAVAAGVIAPGIALRDAPGTAPDLGPGAMRGPRMADVLGAVARVAGLTPEQVLGTDPGRRCARRHARPRHLVMYLLRALCAGASLPTIGHFLGRDHTTVLYGCRKAEALIARDAEFRALHDRTRRALAPAPGNEAGDQPGGRA
jgi:chromosomal replication initiator protein